MIRILQILYVFTKYLFIYLLVKLKIKRKSNEKILKNFFEEAGGAFIKFGQLLTLRIDFLPQEYALEMLDLLDNVGPFPYADVENIFLKELGATPNKIFYDFQKEPFASASFGQVHGAKINENEIVVVKVLRPGIEGKVKTDLFLIKFFAILADKFFSISALSWKEFYQELSKWTKEELDYRVEASNGQKLADNLRNDKEVVIPKIYHDLTTQRILVEEYMEGIHLSRVLKGFKKGKLDEEKLLKLGVDIKKVQKIISNSIYKQYFVDGFCHADPHPGNIIILPGNRVAFIDFGIVGRNSMVNQEMLIKFIENAVKMNIREAAFYFANYAGRDIKQIIVSSFPATIKNDDINDFINVITENFAQNMTKMVENKVEEADESKKDLAGVLIEILKACNHYRMKVPSDTSVILRMFAIKSMMAKQIDRHYESRSNLTEFFKEYSPKMLIAKSKKEFVPRLGREEALEKLNGWLSYLFETEPTLYQLVYQFLAKYKSIDG
jgi:predicted unusual protein kinase regulating ubiquinone biosynthesis (AarF/ABC1/UbiB family)